MKITMTQNLGDGYEDKISIEDSTLTEALVLLDAFFNDRQRVDEAQESVGNVQNNPQKSVDEDDSVWDGAPEWVTHYGLTPMEAPVWYNNTQYKYALDPESDTYTFQQDETDAGQYHTKKMFIELASRGVLI